MRIPKELTPLAYDFSKKVFEGELTHQEGQEQLADNNSLI